nr:MAG TPA: hypothetical protein [Herelleviridae sp.]
MQRNWTNNKRENIWKLFSVVATHWKKWNCLCSYEEERTLCK